MIWCVFWWHHSVPRNSRISSFFCIVRLIVSTNFGIALASKSLRSFVCANNAERFGCVYLKRATAKHANRICRSCARFESHPWYIRYGNRAKLSRYDQNGQHTVLRFGCKIDTDADPTILPIEGLKARLRLVIRCRDYRWLRMLFVCNLIVQCRELKILQMICLRFVNFRLVRSKIV